MTLTTRAAVLSDMGAARPYADSRPLSVQTVTLDPPGPGEVLVAIKAAGLCHSDLSVINGDRPRPLPMALGHEAAGVVEALGPGVTDLKIGDHVVMVFMPSCGHCRAAQPLLAQALAEQPQWQHLKIEDGPGRALGRSYRVKLWPTLILLREGQEVGRVVRPTAEPEVRSALTLALNTPNLLPPSAV